MEFHEKLQELRKQKEMTQEELAEVLYVSRTAISKWESGRGYPNIDSLKAIARFFDITIDELLSGNELLCIAEKETDCKQQHFRDLVFGLLDIGTALLLFLPFFAQKANADIQGVSLLALTTVEFYLKIVYFLCVGLIVVFGILTLALQNCQKSFWLNNKNRISLLFNTITAFVFIISLQPYPATFLFVFLIIKVFILIKK